MWFNSNNKGKRKASFQKIKDFSALEQELEIIISKYYYNLALIKII
ncbi:3035_t:CDS:2 [Entrophospora sp. SA101]|nr:3035_t:CDS:2 [Entrophospora sp. SA101]